MYDISVKCIVAVTCGILIHLRLLNLLSQPSKLDTLGRPTSLRFSSFWQLLAQYFRTVNTEHNKCKISEHKHTSVHIFALWACKQQLHCCILSPKRLGAK